MTTLSKGYYSADSVNGVVFLGDALEDSTQEVSGCDYFYECLADDDCDVVAFFDDSTLDILSKIEKEYGIQ